MTRLAPAVHLDHLRRESARFRAVLADCDPTVRVPACPDWDAADLLWHLADVQWFWGSVVLAGGAPPESLGEGPARPTTYDALLGFFDTSSARLVDALADAGPDAPAWHWQPEQVAATSYRRQAHEALIHRLDAEQTVGAVTPLDPALAADGIAELMEVMYGGTPPDWATFTPIGGPVALDLTDVGATIHVQPGALAGTDPESGRDVTGPHLVVVPDPVAPPATTVAGRAADLDAWLWRRRDDEGIAVTGDRAGYDAFRAAVDQPID